MTLVISHSCEVTFSHFSPVCKAPTVPSSLDKYHKVVYTIFIQFSCGIVLQTFSTSYGYTHVTSFLFGRFTNNQTLAFLKASSPREYTGSKRFPSRRVLDLHIRYESGITSTSLCDTASGGATKMKGFKALALVLGFATSTFTVPVLAGGGVIIIATVVAEPAMACGTQLGTPCDIQRVQSNMPDFVGRTSVTVEDMVCLSVVASAPSELILASGEVAEGEAVTGRVITSWRVQSGSWNQGDDGLYRREICIPTWKIVDVMTLCNELNRSVWQRNDVAMLRRMKRIPANDPACMMGDPACEAIGL